MLQKIYRRRRWMKLGGKKEDHFTSLTTLFTTSLILRALSDERKILMRAKKYFAAQWDTKYLFLSHSIKAKCNFFSPHRRSLVLMDCATSVSVLRIRVRSETKNNPFEHVLESLWKVKLMPLDDPLWSFSFRSWVDSLKEMLKRSQKKNLLIKFHCQQKV